MSKAACAPSRTWEEPASAVHLISRAFLSLERALVVRRERRNLLRLNDQTLKDLGVGRGDAYAEASRPFWDLPCHRAHK
jgi:uncharacterized protein YjiS (DUF1127 family)